MLTTLEQWTAFLDTWAVAAHAVHAALPPLLSYPPAESQDFVAAESRLRLNEPLPPSYRAFLRATNGRQFASREVPVLRPVSRITWFGKECRRWFGAYGRSDLTTPLPPDEIYYCYSSEAASFYKPQHLRHTLQISDVGDAAVFLLNPMVVHPDGEWEAWFLANWLPGVRRFRSFAMLVEDQYDTLAGNPTRPSDAQPVPAGNLPTVYRDPPTVTPRRIVARKPARSVAHLLATARDHNWRTTVNARIKAIDELAARGDRSVIQPLMDLLHDPIPDVCSHAMFALGALHAADAVPELIALVQAGARNHHCAIAALGEIGNTPARDFLVAHIESRAVNTAAAALALSGHLDPRSAAAVTRIMLDPADTRDGDIAGRLLANFGPRAISPLVAAASNPNRVIRRRAYQGLYDLAYARGATSEGRLAIQTLQAAHNGESDTALKGDLKIWLEVLPHRR